MSQKLDNGPRESLGGSDAEFDSIVQNSLSGNSPTAQGGGHGVRRSRQAGRHALSGSKARRRDPMRPRNVPMAGGSSAAPSLADMANMNDDGSDRLLDSNDLQSPNTDEPKDLTPKTIDPTANDAGVDPYDTIGSQYNEQLDPSQSAITTGSDDEVNEQSIARQEGRGGGDGSYAPEKTQAEQDRFGNDSAKDDTLGRGFNPTAAAKGALTKATPAGRFYAAIQGLAKGKNGKRNAGITGALVTGALIIIGFANFGGAFAIQDLRSRLLGLGNAQVNFSRNYQRRGSIHKMMQKIKNGENFKKNFDSDMLVEKLRNEGFIVELGELDEAGKRPLLRFGYESEKLGTTKYIDVDQPLYHKTNKAFYKGSFGNEMGRAYDRATSTEITLHKGVAGMGLFSKMGTKLKNWLDTKKRPDTADTDSKKFSYDLITSDQDTNIDGARYSGPTIDTEDKTDLDGSGKPDALEFQETVNTGLTDEAKKLLQEAQEDPAVLEEVAKAGEYADELAKASSTSMKSGFAEGLDALRKESLDIATKIGGERGVKLAGNIGSAAIRAFDLTDWYNRACRVSGTINFIVNVQSTLFAFELGRFAVKFFVLADNNRMGLLSTEGVSLMMKYLTFKSATSAMTYAQSAGLRWRTGDKTAMVSNTNIARLSGSRAPTGFIGDAKTFFNNATSAGACRITNNGLVQVGAIVAGGVAAFFSGGTITIGQVAASIGLAVLEEAIFLIGEPLLMKVGMRLAVTGLEKDGLFAGEALAAGVGSYFAMNAGVNGLRLMTKPKAALLERQVLANARDAAAEQSLFERYLDIDNNESLLARTAASLPIGFSNSANAFSQRFVSSLGAVSAMPFGSMAFGTGGKVYAAENSQCNDPQVLKYNVEVDPFCNPIVASAADLDLTETENLLKRAGYITEDGTPVDREINGENFTKYIQNCHNGRPGTLYQAEIDKNGTEEETNSDCIENGEPVAGETVTEREAYAYLNEDIEEPTSLFAFMKPKKAYAQTDEAVGQGLVGIRDRFATWYAYTVDERSTVDDINNDFEQIGAGGLPTQQGPTGTTNGPANIVYGDTTEIQCKAGQDLGVHDGYSGGQLYKIRLCAIGQNIQVNSQISQQIDQMLKDALNPELGGGANLDMTFVADSFRSMEDQEYFWAKYQNGTGNLAAQPGYSNHQMGLALDLRCNGGIFEGSPCFAWMQANGASYGMFNLPSEPWHWSVSGN